MSNIQLIYSNILYLPWAKAQLLHLAQKKKIFLSQLTVVTFFFLWISLSTISITLLYFNIWGKLLLSVVTFEALLILYSRCNCIPEYLGCEIEAPKICFTYKPPTAHHCQVCRRCVLRMIGRILLLTRNIIKSIIFSFSFCCQNYVQDRRHSLWIMVYNHSK